MPDSGLFRGSHPLGPNTAAVLKAAREDPRADPNHRIANMVLLRDIGNYLWHLIKLEHVHGVNPVFTKTKLLILLPIFQAQLRAYASGDYPFTRQIQSEMTVLAWWMDLINSPQAYILAVSSMSRFYPHLGS
jgi:hypothetical protein